MHIRRYEPDRDYALFARWNEGHGLDPLPPEALPQIGFIAVAGDTDVAIAFLYRTDSALCHVEWVTKAHDVKVPPAAVTFVVDKLCDFARKAGYKLAFMSTRHPALIRKMESIGFDAPERGTMTNLLRSL